MNTFYMRTSNLEDWRRLLADPDKQWRRGFSAYELAQSWLQAEGLPVKVQSVFDSTEFKDLEILYIFPEHQVKLDTGKAPLKDRGSEFELISEGTAYVLCLCCAIRERFGYHYNVIYSLLQ